MIEIRNVTKRYGEHAVVDRVSLTIPRGGVTSIIGANGAGKSTLLSIISRLLPADEGTVTVDGMDVATTPTERLARRLAILRQDNHMPVRLTVRELVAFGRFPHTGGRLTAGPPGASAHPRRAGPPAGRSGAGGRRGSCAGRRARRCRSAGS